MRERLLFSAYIGVPRKRFLRHRAASHAALQDVDFHLNTLRRAAAIWQPATLAFAILVSDTVRMTENKTQIEQTDVSFAVSVILPLAVYFSHFAIKGWDPTVYRRFVHGELGATELLTLLFLGYAMVLSVKVFRHARASGQKLFAAWMAIMLVGSFYFFGEEASWGQHVFGWQTPENWAASNDQSETNLHNMGGVMGSLLDQVPRNILTLCAFVFGFAYPLWRKKRGTRFVPGSLKSWLFPTTACATVGLLATVASLPGKIFEATPAMNPDYGEIKEVLLALFIMMYVLSIAKRLRPQTTEAPAAA